MPRGLAFFWGLNMPNHNYFGDKTILDAQIINTLKEQAEKLYSRRLSVLARKLKWDRVKLWRLLTGEQAMRLGEFLKLCEALKLVPHQLLKIVGA